MLFDPSTFNSVREKHRLSPPHRRRRFVRRYLLPVLPTCTAIKTELHKRRPVKSDVIDPDYDSSTRGSTVWREINETMNMVGWTHGITSLSPQIDWRGMKCNYGKNVSGVTSPILQRKLSAVTQTG